ncbi:MAG: class IV adenylate cyclase [Patescibacteria group bacterium]
MIEFEVTVPQIDIEDARRRLQKSGAVLQKNSHIQKHIVFNLPEERKIKGGWMRVREESDRVTMSLKIVDGEKITDQQEYFFIAENTEDACKFLTLLGGIKKAEQEKRREIWMLGQCEVTIDEWPFLEPFLEVEGKNEEMVQEAVELLGFEYDKCRVCAVDVLYREKYGVSEDIVDNHTPRIIFDMQNPFLK